MTAMAPAIIVMLPARRTLLLIAEMSGGLPAPRTEVERAQASGGELAQHPMPMIPVALIRRQAAWRAPMGNQLTIFLAASAAGTAISAAACLATGGLRCADARNASPRGDRQNHSRHPVVPPTARPRKRRAAKAATICGCRQGVSCGDAAHRSPGHHGFLGGSSARRAISNISLQISARCAARERIRQSSERPEADFDDYETNRHFALMRPPPQPR